MTSDSDNEKFENYKSKLRKRNLSSDELIEVITRFKFITDDSIDMLKRSLKERDTLKKLADTYEKIVDLHQQELDIYKKGFDKSLQIHEEIKKIKSEQFALAREKGTLANKVKAAANKEFILKTNTELLAHKDWARKTLDERAEYIANACTKNHKLNKDKPYSESYIKKLITGK